jgi:hypothetical protein
MIVRRLLFPGLWLALAAGAFAEPLPPPEIASRAYQVATFFKQAPEEVLDLRRQGYGYGEIVKILVIAREARRPLAELLALNQEGLGWGTIARQSGLSAVKVKSEVDRVRDFLAIEVQPATPKDSGR